jgi:hypothetical protein
MPVSRRKDWSGRPDSNRRPPAPKAGALPGCATPRQSTTYDQISFHLNRNTEGQSEYRQGYTKNRHRHVNVRHASVLQVPHDLRRSVRANVGPITLRLRSQKDLAEKSAARSYSGAITMGKDDQRFDGFDEPTNCKRKASHAP